MKILIVGGVAGGASVAARARRLDEQAEIVLFERGSAVSYANCGLPYYIGGVIEDEDELFLQTPESFWERFRVKVETHTEVIEIDRERHTVRVKNLVSGEIYEETYDKLVLSPGGKAIVPPIPGGDLPRVFCLRSVEDTFRLKAYIDKCKPQSAVVVGGGFIGIEIAENLKHLGLSVRLIEGASQIFAALDPEMSGIVEEEMTANGVSIIKNAPVQAIQEQGSQYSVVYGGSNSDKTRNTSVSCDFVVMAIGVRPDTELAEKAGLVLNSRKAICVDPYMQTSDADIFAAGDAVETVNLISNKKVMLPLAGPANKQGRIIAQNLTEKEAGTFDGVIGSSVAKVFSLTAAGTGLSEKVLTADKIPFEKIYCSPGDHAGYYPGAEKMTLKLIFSPEGRVLGAQAVGKSGVDKRIDVIAAVIRMKGTVSDLAQLELCYAPPYSSAKDPVNYAGFIAENVLNGRMPQKHWHHLKERKSENSILLDVRTEEEFADGALPESVNIPVDELRERLTELDPEKEIWVYCQVGIRGYIAQRILMQSGYSKVFNLSGGYRLLSVCGLLTK